MQSLTKFIGWIVLVSVAWSSGVADEPVNVPEGVTVVTSPIDQLYSDLEFMFNEANEPKAWETLRDFLDGYIVGMERSQSIFGQVRLRTEKNGKNKYHTIWQFPVPDESAKTFIKNIGLLDYSAKEIRGSRGTYKVSGSYTGYLKFISGFACFAEDRDDLSDDLNTAEELSKLLTSPSDLVVDVYNKAEGLEGRREALETTYKEVVGGITKRKNEDPDRFELRKLWTEQQMAEMNRFVAEAARIHIDWTTDAAAKNAGLKIDLEALPETPLAKSVEEIGKTPSMFRNVPHVEKTACSLHINFPLDELRHKNAKSMAEASKSLTQKEIEKNEELSADEKKTATNVSEVVYGAVNQVVDSKIVDCFLNVRKQESGVSTAVGGIRLDGNLLKKTIESNKGSLDIKFAAETEGDVEIHTLEVPADWTAIHELFGKDAVIYLATSADAFWYSIGEGGSGLIHEAIKQSKQTDDKQLPAVLVDAQLAKLAELLDKVQTRLKEGDAEFRAELFKLMSSADDSFHLKIERTGEKVNLEMTAQQGVIKGAGKLVAKGVRENLE